MGINSYGAVAIGGSTPTAKQRALQNGSPKHIEAGMPRALYAVMSWNTSTAGGGLVFYDKYFQQVRASNGVYSFGATAGNEGNFQYNHDGDAQMRTGLFSGMGGVTQTSPSSSTTSNWMNATSAGGEFGNAWIDAYSNSTATPSNGRSSSGGSAKLMLNQRFVDSDHTDKSIVYITSGGIVRAVSRIDGDFSYNYPGTTSHSVSGIASQHIGNGSYNNVRKEFVFTSYVGTAGTVTVSIFKGIDFDLYPSPAAAFTSPDVVRIDRITALTSWQGVNNNEALYKTLPVLVDNGDIYITTMHTSASFAIYKLTRAANDTFSSANYITSKSLTTSYGIDNDSMYGQRRIQTRDGGAVMAYCQYYYYGSGCVSWIIDKRKSVYLNASWHDSSNSSFGMFPVPYGDSGFSCYYAGNVYASNYTGAYMQGITDRLGVSGDLAQVATTIYLPYFPTPNTTNYPGFTQVVDFNMLTNQATV